MILSPFYEVNTVRNGIQAIDFIHKEKVDLVTLDLNMPGLPGIDALRQIKKIDNNVDVVIITGYGTIRTAMDAARFGAADFICKPFNIPEIFSTVRRCFERRAYRLQLKNFIGEIRVKLQDKSQAVSLLALVEESDFGSKPGKLQKELKACLRLFEGRQGADSRSHFTDFLRGLARSSEKISCRPIGHAERVLRYAQIIARDLSSSPKDTADLAKAALLHDIGKIGLGPIASEKTCLSRDELLYVRRHPLVGALLIESFENSPTVTSAIRHHHECWDGKGFPYGLAGEEIPPLARILALANHYDTLVPAGGGRGRILMEKVREEIRKGCGSLFEPALTDSLLKRLADGPLPVGKDEEKNPICGPSLFSPEESQEESLFVF
jgi:putative two-component system response regulator